MPASGAARLGYVIRFAVFLAAAGGGAAACARGDPSPDGPWFVESAAAAGLTFRHESGRNGNFYYPEVIAPGVAIFDSDRDGDLDVFVVQSQGLDGSRTSGEGPRSRLFRNDLTLAADGTHTMRFTDVTDASGLAIPDYGMGVTSGDYDNDGCTDLYVTSLGRNRLFRNNCDGSFADVSTQTGTGDAGWSVSAAFFDFDRDSWLDLFVGHYLTWDVSLNTPCFGSSGRRVYCAPEVYRAQQSRLYRNNRDGTFTDVTNAAGLATQFGPALGVSTADFNGDGWLDLYVANDGEENQLWINQHDGTFVNRGLLSGTALGPFGEAKAGMGVDAGDIDDDGDEDLVVANLSGEGLDLYVNDGSGTFINRAAVSGIGHRSLPHTGFGAGWLDVDNDGWLDLLTVNGAVQISETHGEGDEASALGQPQQLFRNLGNGRFEDVTAAGGEGLLARLASRGAALGDLDNDGDTDVVVANNDGPLQLLVNAVGQRRHWIGLRLVGAHGSDALGARVAITHGGRTRWRRARADGSYASSSDPRVLVGLGDAAGPAHVRVIWPDGRSDEWREVASGRYTTLAAGGALR